jgi:hypothetical protein
MFFHIHSCFISNNLATVAGCFRNKSIRVFSSNANAYKDVYKDNVIIIVKIIQLRALPFQNRRNGYMDDLVIVQLT